MYPIKTCITTTLALLLSACAGDDSPSNSSSVASSSAPSSSQITFNIAFDSTWQGGFADYPPADEAIYQLKAESTQIPNPLQAQSGFNLSGSNHSDDLLMYVKKSFSGLEPDNRYDVEFEVTFATNVPHGCIGVGGAPGESVTVKAGVSTEEPTASIDSQGYLRMDIDMGNQTTSGSDAIAIGNVANAIECGSPEEGTYQLKTLTSEGSSFEVLSNSNGHVWLIFATDSGFEAVTSIYFVEAAVTLTKI